MAGISWGMLRESEIRCETVAIETLGKDLGVGKMP